MSVSLIDRDKAKRELKVRRCKLASELALRFGGFHHRDRPELYEQLYRYWDGDDVPPALETLIKHVSVPNIKWYTRNHLKFEHDVWTPDFLHGLTKCGDIRWSKRQFPSFRWRFNRQIAQMFTDSPFGGKVSALGPDNERTCHCHWRGVPAFYLEHSEYSLSFIAGLLASGVKTKYKGKIYAKYHNKLLPYLSELGIPHEHLSPSGRNYLISPFWPALFTPLMPECRKEYWCDIKDAPKAQEYAAILWTIYVGSDYVTKGIPYLQSRRTILYKYKSEKGALQVLKRKRVQNNLIGLDKLFRECIHNWSQNMYNSTNDNREEL